LESFFEKQTIDGNLGKVSVIWTSISRADTLLYIDGHRPALRSNDSIRLARNAVSRRLENALLHAGQLFSLLNCIDRDHLSFC
jgi:hypothetical protein